ncbi:DUF892 family protein [Halosimplex pelagicum]|uniref:DUF892 family protein n=2 Tax=Halosimplex pelagicum TaxID=869886 RepID=A0A7D5TJM5_9EURY|nr:DUF892 family protein [Halosimplex pelagicum]
MSTDESRELLVEGVQELYYTEQQLVDALDDVAQETEDDNAAQGFSQHREETQEHVERLETVFEKLDEQPREREDPVLDAMIEEHDAFAGDNDGEVLDRYNISAGQKIEHYEIAAYGNVTSLAGKLGEDEAADLLEENLREEEQALDELSQAGEQFDRQQIAGD